MISCEGSRSNEQLTVSWPRLADMTLLISIPECGDWLTQYTDNTEVTRYATCVDIGHYTSLCSNLTDIDVQYHLCFVNRSVCTLQHLTKSVWFWNHSWSWLSWMKSAEWGSQVSILSLKTWRGSCLSNCMCVCSYLAEDIHVCQHQ